MEGRSTKRRWRRASRARSPPTAVGAEYSVSPGRKLIRGGGQGRALLSQLSVVKSGTIWYSRARVNYREREPEGVPRRCVNRTGILKQSLRLFFLASA